MMDSYFMNIAFNEAIKAAKEGNTPVGAVIVYNNKIIAKAHNKKNSLNISTAHAEILVINKACKKLNSWRLNDCILYVTLEPCAMCYAAIIESRINKVFYNLKTNYTDCFIANSKQVDFEKIECDFDYNFLLNSFFSKMR